MENSAKIKNAKARAKIRAAKAAKNVPIAILLKKKAECDAKALKIVEMMTEKNIDAVWMLENLGWLNRSHLEDITEERAILKLCGYPLCDNALTKVINKRYQISTIRNKVYDIEQTKNYCSHSCYLSTNYLMNQMLTSPLWLRDEEKKPTFKTLDKKKLRGSSPPGVEVKLVTLDLPSDSDEEDVPEKKSTPPNNITTKDKNEPNSSSKRSFESQIDKTDDDVNKNNEKTIKNKCKKMKKAVSFGKNEVREFETIETDNTNDDDNDDDDDDDDEDDNDDGWFEFNDDESINESLEKMVIDDKIEINKTIENPIAVKKSIIKKTDENNQNKLVNNYKINKNTKKLDKTQKNMSFESLVSHVEQSFAQWITDDTITFLHGEPSLKQQVIEKVTRDEKFNEVCRKLDLIQIEEEREARMMMKKSTEMKPLPDFEALKEESKNIELKVKAFYQGKIDPSELKIIENKIENKDIDTDDSFVPLTDANDAIALRRRIFLNNLNRVIPDLLQTLAGPDHYSRHFNNSDRTTLIKTLVYTFKLSASNISFKTTEWNLVGLLIIKMLGAIDPIIKNLLSMKKASTYISMILTIYNLSSNYLDTLVSLLTSPRNITN